MMRRFIEGKAASDEDAVEACLAERREWLSKAQDRAYEMIRHVQKLENDEKHKLALRSRLYASLLPHEVQEPHCKAGKKSPILGCVSFRQLMAMRSARSQMGGVCHEWKLNSKLRAVQFAQELEIPTPEHFGTFAADELSEVSHRVLKPVTGAGSKGVFLMGDTEGLDVFRAEVFPKAELPGRMTEVGSDRWISQELVSSSATEPMPARDLKFYCFYGEVALVLEVERFPERRYCWWDGDGKPVDTGKYTQSTFEGVGFDAEALKVAKTLSSAIPAPFCRIDLLKGHDRTVFGEITPRPGGFQDFDADMDFRLGKAFMRAEGRLQQDLLKGKSFHSIFVS